MNEQIVDIAIKANDQTGNEFDLNYKPLDAFLEKFAEILVKECANVCYDADYQGPAFSEAILKHFGIE